MSTIAIVGAGAGLGLAIARTFGSHGFDVALISRTTQNQKELVTRLKSEGINADAFAADVRDRLALTQALEDAAMRSGHIDVLEFSPVARENGGARLVRPAEIAPDDVLWRSSHSFMG